MGHPFFYIIIVVISLLIIWTLYDFFKQSKRKKVLHVAKEKVLHQKEVVAGLNLEVLQHGQGPPAQNGKTLTVKYVARLVSTGKIVDSSDHHGGNFSFKLGSKKVIPGWEKGLQGAQAGQKIRLTMQSKHAYGGQGAGAIPPNEDLLFEIEIIRIT